MWPESLKQFLEKIKRFKPHVENKQSEEYLNLPQSFFKGLSVKKKHEILSLAPLINKHFETVDLIIDVGAGLVIIFCIEKIFLIYFLIIFLGLSSSITS